MDDNAPKSDALQWAPRVPTEKVRRLYESDAAGLIDEALLDDVGIMLLLRCESILRATRGAMGEIVCPVCNGGGEETVIRMEAQPAKSDIARCPGCGWQVTWGQYQRSYQRKQLWAGGATEFFSDFVRQYPLAKSASEKMLAIDRLIHEFHYHAGRPTRAAGVNLIEGRLADVVAFLDALSNDCRLEGRSQASAAWHEKIDSIDWHPKGSAGM